MTCEDTGITEEERQAFMNGMETDKPDDIKRGSDGEYYVEKVIKMHLKEGREEFLVKWIDYPLSEATWEPLKIFMARKHVSILIFLLLQSHEMPWTEHSLSVSR